MARPRLVCDTNILLRLLTGDSPRAATRCRRLIEQAVAGEVELVVSTVCIAEVLWTLKSFYGDTHENLQSTLQSLLNTPGLVFERPAVLQDAAGRFKRKGVHFIDAYHAALAAAEGVPICSFDRDFDKFDDIQRVEP
jgi:uncharacterized protein